MMKLEFERDLLSEDLKRELNFDHYLELFDLSLPLIHSRILRPMSKEEGITYFEEVQELEESFQESELQALSQKSGELHNLDDTLPYFKAGNLEQFHLLELGNFLQVNAAIEEKECKHPLPGTPAVCLGAINSLLCASMENNFSVFKVGEAEEQIRRELEGIDQALRGVVREREHRVFESTGLKMTYPYPKEISLLANDVQKLEATGLLTVTPREGLWLIELNIDEGMRKLIAQREMKTARLSELIERRLHRLNAELRPLYGAFEEYYRQRVRRTWFYAVLCVKNTNGLSLPVFTAGQGCTVVNGVVSTLLPREKEKCVPLNIDLQQGSNVLFGANMSGKTTVLKTVYFFLTLIRVGLPVPAEAIRLHYPEYVAMLLKSSGNLNLGVSAFGEEINFFSRRIADGDYVLCDELFLSTDPVNGADLSTIFINHYAKKKIVFFCTTHYPQVLDIPEIGLFRMRNPDPVLFSEGAEGLTNLQQRMPYEVERLTVGEGDAQHLKQKTIPLEIALLFPLSDGIKSKIRQRIAAYRDGSR